MKPKVYRIQEVKIPTVLFTLLLQVQSSIARVGL
jgi:hypothetical protein